MKFPSIFVFVPLFLWALLGSAGLVRPITNSMADQVRSGTLVMLNSPSVASGWVYFNVAYSRSFPAGLSFSIVISICDFYRTVTAGTNPVILYVYQAGIT